MRNLKFLFIFLLTSFSWLSMADMDSLSIKRSIRRQVVRSQHFLNFKQNKMNSLRSRGDSSNGFICIMDEYRRKSPSQPLGDFQKERLEYYRKAGNEFVMNTLEACVEYHYISENCSDYHDESVMCNDDIFTKDGIGETTSAVGLGVDDRDRQLIDKRAIEDTIYSILQEATTDDI